MIKQFRVRGGMELLNLSRKAIGKYTFTLGNRQSCIDYVIVGEVSAHSCGLLFAQLLFQT